MFVREMDLLVISTEVREHCSALRPGHVPPAASIILILWMCGKAKIVNFGQTTEISSKLH